MDEDDIKKHKNDNHIGCNLDAFSLDELEDYIGDLVILLGMITYGGMIIQRDGVIMIFMVM